MGSRFRQTHKTWACNLSNIAITNALVIVLLEIKLFIVQAVVHSYEFYEDLFYYIISVII